MKIFEFLPKMVSLLLNSIAFLLGAGVCLIPIVAATWFILKYGLCI